MQHAACLKVPYTSFIDFLRTVLQRAAERFSLDSWARLEKNSSFERRLRPRWIPRPLQICNLWRAADSMLPFSVTTEAVHGSWCIWYIWNSTLSNNHRRLTVVTNAWSLNKKWEILQATTNGTVFDWWLIKSMLWVVSQQLVSSAVQKTGKIRVGTDP